MIVPVWHIEPTSRCTLACPKCPRTMHPDVISNQDLEVDSVRKFFTEETLFNTTDVLFCGNHGDPIYHPDFINLVKTFIDAKPTINLRVITNGAFRSEKWWDELLSVLRPNDKLSLSIDGLDDTNHLYRMNSKWDSLQIILNKISTAKIITEWRFIVFKHNEHQINDAKDLATKLGFDLFTTIKSTRYTKDDPLMPSKEWVSNRWFERVEMIESGIKTYIDPSCAHGMAHYISSEGTYAPCCHMLTAPHYKDQIFHQNEIFNIKNSTLQEMHDSDAFMLFTDSWKSDTPHYHCQRVCGMPIDKEKEKAFKIPNNDYLTERLDQRP